MTKLSVIKSLPSGSLVIDNTNSLHELDEAFLSSEAIVLLFPTFMDGRAYSQARRLRREGFKGELIASGDIRADQARQYAQVGFTALYFEKPFDQKIIDDELNRFPEAYQNTFAGTDTVYDLRVARSGPHFSGGGAF
ncbi:DUF934 domain-containing protein [Pseudemcibacter aquimaris]|uniref:DUF934 domain-containing protein n=1 Tax=Pseudemcibacter aquimaris TaxID=2857064 RepID=UPI0020120B05|nr:DUF934 domain-containing protein [Pseudemcibacter aquimaris]MCC3861197.1 DUF934 domain-containing protein [Pseudemcibacter aquimaris]WDU57972.1 DUF934 domain-containing protein [Pseudemcibacter aquimaris]